MTDEQNKINQAFERFLLTTNTYFSKKDLESIAVEYGSEAAIQAKKIYDEAIDAPVDWRTATMDSALGVLHDFLDREYSWLSPKARTNINYAFIMTWK